MHYNCYPKPVPGLDLQKEEVKRLTIENNIDIKIYKYKLCDRWRKESESRKERERERG